MIKNFDGFVNEANNKNLINCSEEMIPVNESVSDNLSPKLKCCGSR